MPDAHAAPPPCTNTQIENICAPATATASRVVLACNIDFNQRSCATVMDRPNRITKKLIVEGSEMSGMLIDCAGGEIYAGPGSINYKKGDTIEIRSIERSRTQLDLANDRVIEGVYDRPTNVTVRNCNVTGAIRVWGIGKNGEASGLKLSSRLRGHTRRTRNAAPRDILLDNITLTGTGRNPLYFAPGVSHSTLQNSEVKGKSSKVGIYFDAESFRNTLRNNTIHVKTGTYWYGRDPEPLVALDGSSHNLIINNHFSALNHGGIYLYRNCGLAGVSRHATPSHNQIINNRFYYNKYKGDHPAVYIGAHGGGFFRTFPIFGSCKDDDDYGYGSAKSNDDHATHNVIVQNQVYKRSPGKVFKVALRSPTFRSNLPAYIAHNTTVTQATVDKSRRAGCYFPEQQPDFLTDGESFETLNESSGRLCYGEQICRDGVAGRGVRRDCRIVNVDINCSQTGSNDWCETTARCPARHRVVGAKAACNLETQSINDAQVAALGFNQLQVVRASDNKSAGECYIGFARAREGSAIVRGVRGFPRVAAGCREHDKNGGDCRVRGEIYCQPLGARPALDRPPRVLEDALEIRVPKTRVQDGRLRELQHATKTTL